MPDSCLMIPGKGYKVQIFLDFYKFSDKIELMARKGRNASK